MLVCKIVICQVLECIVEHKQQINKFIFHTIPLQVMENETHFISLIHPHKAQYVKSFKHGCKWYT